MDMETARIRKNMQESEQLKKKKKKYIEGLRSMVPEVTFKVEDSNNIKVTPFDQGTRLLEEASRRVKSVKFSDNAEETTKLPSLGTKKTISLVNTPQRTPRVMVQDYSNSERRRISIY